MPLAIASPQRPSAAWGFSCTNPGSMWDRVWKDWKLLTGTCQQDTVADIQAAAISKFKSASTNFACRTTVTHIYYTSLLQQKKAVKSVWKCHVTQKLILVSELCDLLASFVSWAAWSFCAHNSWIPVSPTSTSAQPASAALFSVTMAAHSASTYIFWLA